MNKRFAAVLLGAGVLLAVGASSGCVERRMRIRTDPAGALIFVNDEEIGLSPVTFAFLWYGDYDIIARKPGFKTLKTHYRVDPPWYQLPPFDLVAETLIPTTIRDEHEVPTLTLEPAETPAVEDVVRRAVELRERALFETP